MLKETLPATEPYPVLRLGKLGLIAGD